MAHVPAFAAEETLYVGSPPAYRAADRDFANFDFDRYHAIQKLLGFPIAKLYFYRRLGYQLDLNNPLTLNQKLTYRKLHCRNPIWISVTDKVAVRDWLVRRGIPKNLNLIPTVGVFNSFEEIQNANLPKTFIAKAAWASAQNAIVRNVSQERDEFLKSCASWYSRSSAYGRRHLIWPAQHILRRVIVEELLMDGQNKAPADYKFFCFHGKCKFFQVDMDRFSGHARRLFWPDGKPIDVAYNRPIARDAELPPELPTMIDLAEDLAADFGFVRVDLYSYDGHVFFGELTQTPGNGTEPFNPREFDLFFGRLWAYP